MRWTRCSNFIDDALMVGVGYGVDSPRQGHGGFEGGDSPLPAHGAGDRLGGRRTCRPGRCGNYDRDLRSVVILQSATAAVLLYLLTAKGTQSSPHVALRGIVLLSALNGRSKIKPLRRKNTRRLDCGGSVNSTLSALACGRLCQPPAPGARTIGRSLSAPSDHAAV